MKKKKKTESKGFTLVELMIVVGIIGILAAIAVPKFGEAIEKANLGATLGNLAALRTAVNIYSGSFSHVPDDLNQDDPSFAKVMNPVPYVVCKYPGGSAPYGNKVTVGTASPSGPDAGWYYNNKEGYVYINSTEQDIHGINYTTY